MSDEYAPRVLFVTHSFLSRMITIQPIQAHQICDAKRVILMVARKIYAMPGSLEDTLREFDANGELHDMDDFQAHYFARRGLFLVVLDDERVIGRGAVRQIDAEVCELKRMWLLEDYHGQGIGA